MSLIVYFEKNWKNIYLVTWILFMLLIIFTVYNVKFPLLKIEEEQKKKGYKHGKPTTIVYEGQQGQKSKEGFCDSGKNIYAKCSKLKSSGEEACTTQPCCVWTQSKDKKTKKIKSYCVSGTEDGPEVNQDMFGNNFFRYLHDKVERGGGNNIVNWKTFTG